MGRIGRTETGQDRIEYHVCVCVVHEILESGTWWPRGEMCESFGGEREGTWIILYRTIL